MAACRNPIGFCGSLFLMKAANIRNNSITVNVSAAVREAVGGICA